MSSNASEKDIELKEAYDSIRAVTRQRQGHLIRQRSLPRIMPPIIAASAFPISLFLDAWQHIPEQARPIGLAAFALGVLATPFLKFTSKFPFVQSKNIGSPIVYFSDAANSIDEELGTKNDKPLKDFFDSPSEKQTGASLALWAASRKNVAQKWLYDIQKIGSDGDRNPYYEKGSFRTISHAAILMAVVASATYSTNTLSNGWDTAMDWTPPPPPLEYTVQIRPPELIRDRPVLTDQMIRDAVADGTVFLTPHDHSELRITSYNREIDIFVNGERVDAKAEQEDPRINRRNGDQYFYEVLLTPEVRTVSFEDVRYNFDIEPDTPPDITIISARPDPSRPGFARIEYVIKDNNGAVETFAEIGLIDAEGNIVAPSLENEQFPIIPLPSQ